MKGSKTAIELVALKKEDHWLSRGETRLPMLETSVAFLRAHNPPTSYAFSLNLRLQIDADGLVLLLNDHDGAVGRTCTADRSFE